MRKFYLILALLMSALTSSAQTSYEGKMEFDIPEVDITASLLPAKDHDSLADALGEPLGTVTWRYKNALEKLRRYGYEA